MSTRENTHLHRTTKLKAGVIQGPKMETNKNLAILGQCKENMIENSEFNFNLSTYNINYVKYILICY